jgi:hypothetical protein
MRRIKLQEFQEKKLTTLRSFKCFNLYEEDSKINRKLLIA